MLYELLDDIRDLMEGLLAPELREEITGHAEVRALFKSSKIGVISGCMVIDGSLFRDSRVRVKREGKVVHDGVLYTTTRDGREEKYVHEFRKRDKPLLCVSPDGEQLFIVAGRYVFTERGIVDRSDKKNLPARLR